MKKRNEEPNTPNNEKEKRGEKKKKRADENSNLTHNYAYAPNEAIRMLKVHTHTFTPGVINNVWLRQRQIHSQLARIQMMCTHTNTTPHTFNGRTTVWAL